MNEPMRDADVRMATAINSIKAELEKIGFRKTMLESSMYLGIEMTDDVDHRYVEFTSHPLSEYDIRNGIDRRYVFSHNNYKFIAITPVFRHNGTDDNVSIRVSCGRWIGDGGIHLFSIKFNSNQRMKTQMKKVMQVVEHYRNYNYEDDFTKHLEWMKTQPWIKEVCVMIGATYEQAESKRKEIEEREGIRS